MGVGLLFLAGVRSAQFGINLKQLECFGSCCIVIQRLKITT